MTYPCICISRDGFDDDCRSFGCDPDCLRCCPPEEEAVAPGRCNLTPDYIKKDLRQLGHSAFDLGPKPNRDGGVIVHFSFTNPSGEVTWEEAVEKVKEDFEESMYEADIDDYSFSQWRHDDPVEFASQLNAYLQGGE